MKHQVLLVGSGLIVGFFLRSLLKSGYQDIVVIEANSQNKGPRSLSGGLFKTYHLHKGIADLCIESHTTYTGLTEDLHAQGVLKNTEQNLFAVKPTLSLVPPARFKAVRAEVRRLQKMGVAIDMVGAKAVNAEFSGLALHAEHRAVVERNAGTVAVDLVSESLRDYAQSKGVQFKAVNNIESLRVESGRIVGLVADSKLYESELTVLTDDLSSFELLKRTGIDLCLYLKHEQSHRFQVNDVESSSLPNMVDYSTRSYLGRSVNEVNEAIGGVVLSERVTIGDEIHRSWIQNSGASVKVAPRLTPKATQSLAINGISNYWPNIRGLELRSTTEHLSVHHESGIGCNGFVPGFDGLYAAMGWGGEAFKVAPAVARAAVEQILRQQFMKKRTTDSYRPVRENELSAFAIS